MICLPPNFQLKKWTSARVRALHAFTAGELCSCTAAWGAGGPDVSLLFSDKIYSLSNSDSLCCTARVWPGDPAWSRLLLDYTVCNAYNVNCNIGWHRINSLYLICVIMHILFNAYQYANYDQYHHLWMYQIVAIFEILKKQTTKLKQARILSAKNWKKIQCKSCSNSAARCNNWMSQSGQSPPLVSFQEQQYKAWIQRGRISL